MARLQKIIWFFISINYLYANEDLSSSLFINNTIRNEIIIVIDCKMLTILALVGLLIR